MARPQETFNKKELEKKRAQKKKEKEQRKQDRKANAKSGQSLDDMMAYVDETEISLQHRPIRSRKRASM